MQVNRSFSGHVYFQAPNLIPSAPFVANAEQTKFEEAHIHMPPCCTFTVQLLSLGLLRHVIHLRHRHSLVLLCGLFLFVAFCSVCLHDSLLLFLVH